MASGGPFPGDVDTLQEFLGIPRPQATVLLEKYVTVEQAVNQYFEDPVGSVKPRLPQNQWEPADNIPYADDTVDLPSMSRPPSRVESRVGEPGSSRMQAEAGIPTAEEMQDPELQRAIALSKQDLAGQETGVLETGQQFGPANRPYYDASKWAMTVASSREIFEHPPPTKRRGVHGQPAFLRGSLETGYLAPLLNIYHSIPLAREAFLLPQMRVLHYGNDPQWWSGMSDENSKSLSIEALDGNSQDRQNFLAELQCLMAFLDGTNRAYGSVDALSDLKAMRGYNSESQLSRLLETWVAAAMIQSPDNQLTQIFTSTAIKAPDMEGYSPIRKDLVCLEPTARRKEGQSLGDLLDSTIWDDLADKVDDIWIEQCAEVFTMRLYDPTNEDKGLGLEIPPIWYPDRYMYEYREITRRWRREILTIRHEINQCALIQRRCEVAQGPGKRVIKIRDVLEAASKLCGAKSDVANSSEVPETESSSPSTRDSDDDRTEKMQSQLHDILQRIDEKVKVLEQRKEELNSRIKGISSQMTMPGPDPDLSPRHRYYLQGVSTKPNITYVRRRREQSLIEISTEEEISDFQWWRIVWGDSERVIGPAAQPTEQHSSKHDSVVQDPLYNDAKSDDKPYSINVVGEFEVLEAAKNESNSIVLVYANENAMNFTPSAPSAALRKFVELDNRDFEEEISQEKGRLRRSSQETNTTIMEEITLDPRSTTPSNEREMTPMSTTSPLRDADGQPSPKRAKSDDQCRVYRESDPEDYPPPYNETAHKPQMQEKKVNKIGILADQMLEKYDSEPKKPESDGPVHIEHAREPIR